MPPRHLDPLDPSDKGVMMFGFGPLCGTYTGRVLWKPTTERYEHWPHYPSARDIQSQHASCFYMVERIRENLKSGWWVEIGTEDPDLKLVEGL